MNVVFVFTKEQIHDIRSALGPINGVADLLELEGRAKVASFSCDKIIKRNVNTICATLNAASVREEP